MLGTDIASELAEDYVTQQVKRNKRRLVVQTGALLLVLILLAARGVALIFGPGAAVIAVALASFAAFAGGAQRSFVPRGSRQVTAWELPDLYPAYLTLSRRAGLSQPPPLYISPGPPALAFTSGTGDAARIVISAGMLHSLPPREVLAVLAHELSHIRNRDLTLYAVIAAMQRLMGIVATLLVGLTVISLPMVLFGRTLLPPGSFVYLALVPAIGMLAQFAILRRREFGADLGAVELTGDPEALATALQRLDRTQQPFLSRMFGPTPEQTGLSALLRTHPSTAERVERLRQLATRTPSRWILVS